MHGQPHIRFKKKAYLRYLTTRSETDKTEYKRLVAIVEKKQVWKAFVSRIEHDVYVRQTNAYKIIRNLNRTDKDNLQLNPITEHTWLDYYQQLWNKQFNGNTTERKRAKLTENCVNLITTDKCKRL